MNNVWPVRFAALITPAVFALACALPCSANQTLFYTGDPNNEEAIGDYNNPLGGPLSLSQIFEPFTVGGDGWDISSVFFTQLDIAPTPVTTAEWSIRSGMAPGYGGTRIAGGTAPTSGTLGNDTTLTVDGLDVILAPGTYWLNITPNSASGRLFADATSGANDVDSTLQGDALWYEPGVQYFSRTNADFTAGADGVAVPEPGTFWLLLPLAAVSAILAIRRSFQIRGFKHPAIDYCAQQAAASTGS